MKKCPDCGAKMYTKYTNILTERGVIVKVKYWVCPDCAHTERA